MSEQQNLPQGPVQKENEKGQSMNKMIRRGNDHRERQVSSHQALLTAYQLESWMVASHATLS